MKVTIKVHSWIGESLRNYLKGIGFEVNGYAVDPGGDGWSFIDVTMPGGWNKKILEKRIVSCDIPTKMFEIN